MTKKSINYRKIFFSPLGCALVVLSLLVLACESGAPSSVADKGDRPPGALRVQDAAAAPQSPAGSAPVQGDRLLLGSIGEPSNLIPFLSTDSASQEVAGSLFVGLLRYDKNLNIEPWAASAYEVLDGGHRLRFTLRDDIYWEDGARLTVDDVEYTYRVTIDPATPTAYAEDFLAVSSFTKIDALSFEATYDKLYSRALVSWMSGIMPKHILEKQDLMTTPFARKPIGAGPFRLKSWDSGRQLILTASDTYFAGRPYLDEIVYRMIPDLATMFLELKAGRLDSMNLTPQQYLRQTGGDWWQEYWRKHRYLSFGYTYLGYNLAHPLFADVRVRRALTYAIDRQAIIGGVLLGQGEPTVGPFVPGTWPYNDKLEPYPYDPDRARRLLAEAGWIADSRDGLLHKDGKPFSFTILTNQGNDQRIKAAIIIQSQLRAVGISVRIRTVEWAAFIKEFVHKGRFDALILGWTVPQAQDPYSVWHSSKAKPGGLNVTRYCNAEVDKLLEEARLSLDEAVRKPLYDRFQEILHDEQPYTFLYVPYALPIVAARFQGIEPAPAGIMYNVERWWTPRARQKHQVTP